MRQRCIGPHHGLEGPGGLQLGFLLQGLILKLLSQKPLHGYEIFTKIEESFPEIPNFRGLVMRGVGYRVLRMMEEMGLISSEWDVSVGPARRVYKITEEGLRALHNFNKNLEILKDTIEKFINF
jgi:DNA-binding PadR family transcriptional regulator